MEQHPGILSSSVSISALKPTTAHAPQRRNLAILYAYERGAEAIITIDDDNFFVEGQDFIGDHCAPIVGPPPELDALSSSSAWLNVCAFLEDHRRFAFYPRGYPMAHRWPPAPPLVRLRFAARDFRGQTRSTVLIIIIFLL